MWAAVVSGLKALAAMFGFGEKIVGEVHDDSQRKAGMDAQKVSVQDKTIDSLQKQQKAAVNGPHTGDDAEDRLRKGTF
jgi:hypothetical protein